MKKLLIAFMLLMVAPLFAQSGPGAVQSSTSPNLPTVGAACTTTAVIVDRDSGTHYACVSSVWAKIAELILNPCDIVQYGAIADDNVDDSVAIQAAIDAVIAGTCDSVHIGCGEFDIDKDKQITIESTSGVTIWGEGDCSLIDHDDDGTGSATPPIYIGDADYTLLENFQIKSNRDNTPAAQSSVIDIDGSADAGTLIGLKIINLHIRQASIHGIRMNDVEDFLISGNRIEFVAQNAIRVETGSEAGRIVNNYITRTDRGLDDVTPSGPGAITIYADASPPPNGITIAGNRIYDSQKNGINVYMAAATASPTDIKIVGNDIKAVDEEGIECNAKNCTIDGNTIDDAGLTGIRVDSVNEALTGVTITGNVIKTSAGSAGITLETGTTQTLKGVAVTGNTIISGVSIAYIDDSAGAAVDAIVISGNTCLSCSATGSGMVTSSSSDFSGVTIFGNVDGDATDAFQIGSYDDAGGYMTVLPGARMQWAASASAPDLELKRRAIGQLFIRDDTDVASGSICFEESGGGAQALCLTMPGTIDANFTWTFPEDAGTTTGTSTCVWECDATGQCWCQAPTLAMAVGATAQVLATVEASSDLSKGDPVYIDGYNAACDSGTGCPTVDLADADGGLMPVVGLMLTDVTTGNEGSVVVMGVLNDVDTSTWSIGDALYISTTAGQFTNTRPSGASTQVQKVGTVIKDSPTLGRILISGANRSNDVPNTTSQRVVLYGATSFGTCDATEQGAVVNVEAGAGTTDYLAICQKGADDAYEWFQLSKDQIYTDRLIVGDGTASADARIIFNSDTTNDIYWSDGDSCFYIEGAELMFGSGAAADQCITFDSDTEQQLCWDNTASRFKIDSAMEMEASDTAFIFDDTDLSPAIDGRMQLNTVDATSSSEDTELQIAGMTDGTATAFAEVVGTATDGGGINHCYTGSELPGCQSGGLISYTSGFRLEITGDHTEVTSDKDFGVLTSGGSTFYMKSPDGTCSACTVDNSDVFSCTSATCPE